ncbi:MAG: tyrosine decarboxylase [Candidatus Margulisbacteria bacterium]|nr:tyrosine decarboxylase [Candidatus Margulisiibacteriota bacterium]MBU1021619.1 tyrosine decarboxylase [Candidatus Margulisiibacteriota bacterium]MBU1728769.1 tyrosine decarboxylase [Candidatus Margulisiibacteriota bacterium]MBU1955735.1 tyrosine decarboxylase [Candidatus Margulisiibacteriota bacterium]
MGWFKRDNNSAKVNVDALFLGPKSENQGFFTNTLNFLMEEHIQWRRDFHPDDKPAVSLEEQDEQLYKDTLRRTKETLLELSGKLKTTSMPWFSPRYLGHMNSDTLMAANLAYMATILYNPNNCAFEASPATTGLEIQAGKQLCTMLGFDANKGWGHITSGGHVANYEAFWVARNLKSFPMAVKAVLPNLVKGLDDWQLLNLPVSKVLDLVDKVKAANKFDEVRALSARGVGMSKENLGVLLVPQSRHYSWAKAADILGIGTDNLINVQVKDNYRMDVNVLKATIDKFIATKTPILGVVAVVGTTEEGAVDEVHEIAKLRDEYEKQGISFYFHIDGAYGGYARAIFLDENDKFMDMHKMKHRWHEEGIIHKDIDWPPIDVYEAYKAFSEADSITVDPHKMGYVPYAAGAVVMKDRRILDLISYFAAYVFEKGNDPMLLGSYILEGSKAGATAAAVWASHEVIPLNITGYGRIIGRSITGAQRFYMSLKAEPAFEVNGKKYIVHPLTKPDFNIVDFAFNAVGNTDLAKMDDLNEKLYELSSYNSGPVYANDWITSKTSLATDAYGDAPASFVAVLGIPKEQWDKQKSVYVLRSCVLSPWLIKNTTYNEYWGTFLKIMQEKIGKIVKG